MLDILRDEIWQFIGAILALLAILFAYWLHVLQTKKKELAFGVLSKKALISVHEDIAKRIEISLDGIPVTDVYLVVLGIKNSGNSPIIPSDFLSDFSINFGPESKIVSWDITSQIPRNLGATAIASATAIKLQPLLLNPLDQIIIQALVSSKSMSIEADARIAGVSFLAEATTPATSISIKDYFLTLSASFFTCFGLTLAISELTNSLRNYTRDPELVEFIRWVGYFGITVVAFIATTLLFIHLKGTFGPEIRRKIHDR